jgi:hypothetical protein
LFTSNNRDAHEREFVTGNEIPSIVAHKCSIETSTDISQREAQSVTLFKPKRTTKVQAKEAPMERDGIEREFVTSNDKPRIVAYRYIIEASTDVS